LIRLSLESPKKQVNPKIGHSASHRKKVSSKVESTLNPLPSMDRLLNEAEAAVSEGGSLR